MFLFFFTFFIQFRENYFGSQDTFIKPCWGKKKLLIINLHFNHGIELHPDENNTFISDFTKYELNQKILL